MTDQIKKAYIGGQVTQEEYRRFYRLASSMGLNVPDLVPRAILFYMECSEDANDESKIPLDVKFHKRLVQLRKGPDIENALRDLALAYYANPTDEASDILTVSAEEAGFTKEQILQWIEEDKLVPIGNSSSTLDKAVDFLARMMEPGQEYESLTITEKGNAEGFSDSILGAAKRKLNVRSERRAKCWVWVRE